MPDQNSDYPFGARLTAYRSDWHDYRCGENRSSELTREEFYSTTAVVERVASLVNDDYDEDEMELLVFLDEEHETARVVTAMSAEFHEIVLASRDHAKRLYEEAKQREREAKEEAERRRIEATEKAERSNYERLKAKYEVSE